MAKRRRVDITDMTDDEVRSLVAEARRRGWTAMRIRGQAELARRGLRS